MRNSVFVRLLSEEDKAAALKAAIDSLNFGVQSNEDIYIADPSSLQQIPGTPFAYWVSDNLRDLFTNLPTFDCEEEGRATRCGLGTLDDFRFLRLRWEIKAEKIEWEWTPYYHGGVYAQF